MKCIKKIIDDETVIKRVDDKTAESQVRNDGWSFCPRSEWKEVDEEHKKRADEENRRKANLAASKQ